MADLSDDLGDFISLQLKELARELLNRWRYGTRSHETKEQKEQRELQEQLDRLSRQNPTDPVVPIYFEPTKDPENRTVHPAMDFLKELESRGYNNITLIGKDTLAVPQSVVMSVMDLARRTGYKEWQRDPMKREVVIIECDTPERCRKLADAMQRERWDVEPAKGAESASRLVCMVGEAERDEFMRDLEANGYGENSIVHREPVQPEQALEADLDACREEAREQGHEPAAEEKGVREVIADGEVVSVTETLRDHPDTARGEDAVDDPGGPDDEAPEEDGKREENDPLDKQRADAEGWLREQRGAREHDDRQISRPEEVR